MLVVTLRLPIELKLNLPIHSLKLLLSVWPLNYRFKITPELPTAQLQTLGPFNVKMSCSPHKCSQSLVRAKVNSEMNKTTVMKFRCKFATFLSKQNNGKDIYLIRNSQEFVITCTARTMTKFYNNCKTNSK